MVLATDVPHPQKMLYLNLISIIVFHLVSLYSLFHIILFAKHLSYTLSAVFALVLLGGIGVTAGVHRLWCHKSYKAKIPFRIFLAFCYSITGQNSIFNWVRDHRVHHKYSDTDADPHNASRGFWFSHVGWLTMTKHRDVIEKGNTINMTDVINDPVVYYHEKFFYPLKIMLCFVVPSLIPIYLWNENIYVSILSQAFLRYALTLNITWSVNSFAHLFGSKPFNKNIYPSENLFVALFAIGEGWHNYHHVFPYDYKTGELGSYKTNVTTMILDFANKLGLVYDMKQPSKENIIKYAEKYGDSSLYKTESIEEWDTIKSE